MTFHTHRHPPSPARTGAARAALAPGGKRLSPAFRLLGTGLALGTALLLFAAGAQAAGSATGPAASGYSVAQIAQAFSFIDGNKDGKLSRGEAAGFRGVARHFDEADINKDGVLSRQEFENALSGAKAR